MALLVPAVMTGCFGSGSPRVEIMENGVYMRHAVQSYTITGARNGATTHATALITLHDGDRITIDLDVAYNPAPELAAGEWKREGKVAEAGQVHAESLKFLGGQGSTPSVGGRFRLETNGNPRLRVLLPAQPLARAPQSQPAG